MILKELVDNAMDTGTPVTSELVDDDTVVVADEGDGVDLTAFSIKRPLQSSKHWRTGKRGALGNGMRAVMGAVYHFNGTLDVTTGGVTTRLTVAPSATSNTR